jgi:hypothetical protein
MDLWATLGPAHFYYRYRFDKRKPTSWDERVMLAEDAGIGCETCAFALQARLAEVVAFEEESQARKLRVLDVFAGAGAMSLGMEGGMSGGMTTTHAIELAPSAAQTFRCVFPALSLFCLYFTLLVVADEIPRGRSCIINVRTRCCGMRSSCTAACLRTTMCRRTFMIIRGCPRHHSREIST